MARREPHSSDQHEHTRQSVAEVVLEPSVAGPLGPSADDSLNALARLLARQAAAELLGAGDVGSGGTSGGPEPSPSLAIPHELRDID